MPAYTGHGHHIPGTSPGPEKLPNAIKCGGVENCPRCKAEVESSMAYMVGEKVDYQAKAKDMVRAYVDGLHKQNHPDEDPLVYEVYVVWFAKTLQNWKAILGTTMPDSRLFELTYDGNKKTTYFDCYYKADNFPIPDEQ
jgi:hypothetical protein